jgi:CheY-like chemotaxis protein
MNILVAEDEKDIAFAYKKALEERNHTVAVTNDGQECLKVYKKRLQAITKETGKERGSKVAAARSSASSLSSELLVPFDAVILDYKMPKKDGLQVAKKIFSLRPKQRVIFASAYVKNTLEESLRELEQVVEVMQKPFNVNALIATVEDKQISDGLNMLMSSLTKMKGDRGKGGGRLDPTQHQIRDLFEGLRKIQKGRTF